MNKINFTNLPSTDTPVNANNLNTMQDNIEAEIQPLKENILSNNLFDGKLLTDKAHSSTGVITSSGISTNENYIPVKEGKSIAISNNGKAMACDIFFYNASYTYMSVVRSTSTTEVPTGASYVAFNVATADLTGNKIMVNYGTEPMEYEEYVNAIAELEAEIGTKVSKSTAYGGDLNDINDTAFYYCLAEATNKPTTALGYCFTHKYSTNYMVQYFEERGSQTTYKRFKEAGTWTDWRDISLPTTVTNDNGTAIMFPDGTMICRGTVNCEANSASVVVNFPAAFVNTSFTVSATPLYNNDAYITVTYSKKTTESVTLYPRVDKNNVTYSQKIDYIAIGRWK